MLKVVIFVVNKKMDKNVTFSLNASQNGKGGLIMYNFELFYIFILSMKCLYIIRSKFSCSNAGIG